MFNEYAGLSAGGARTRTTLAALGGLAVGVVAPKLINYLQSKGVPPDQAQAQVQRIVDGTIPPPAGAPLTDQDRSVLAQLRPKDAMAWIAPVGFAAVAIGAMVYLMPKGGGRRRRRR